MATGEKRPAVLRYQSATSFNLRECIFLIVLWLVILIALAVPALVVLLDGWLGMEYDINKPLPHSEIYLVPPDYSDADFSVADWGAAAYADLGEALAQYFKLPDHATAVARWEAQPGNASSGMGRYLKRNTEGGLINLWWVNGIFLLNLAADNEAALAGLVRLSPMIDAPGEPGYLTGPRPFMAVIIDRYPWLFVLLVDLLMVLFMWAIFGGGIAFATRRPLKGTPQVSREELRMLLLALNDTASPFMIEERAPFWLVARWKFDDAEFASIFGAEGVKEAYQLDIYLGRGGTAHVLETRGTISWALETIPPSASISWSYMRGIVLYEVKVEQEWSFDLAELRFKHADGFTFNAQAYKAPLAKTVIGSGWCWRPVMFRPLNWRG